ncbi:MAG: hypothetical protein ISS82_03010, partial [Nanoarchaeota archaeon]|nr:hypothetical protein [Nanoarchaeota archaeon]
MKKLILVILLFFISLSCVSANNYSKSDGLNWLNSHVSWASASIEDVSFALLALNSNNYDITTGLGFLKSRKDTTGCYPTGACTTKDTALAALALSELGEDITNQLNWINQTLKQADVTGAWIIQIIPGISTGICTFTHKQNSQEIEITEPSSQWIYIQNDLSISITDPIETINVNCDLPSTTKISLIRKVGTSEFHIVQEETSNNVDMIINNACYPQTLTSTSCNIESSFYVSWALNKLNQEINTLPYLEDNVNNNLYYTMIQSIDSNQNYITYLISNQNSAGYWTDIYTTSFVINSLKTDYSSQNAVENATSWLEAQQVTTPGENQGSWNNGNVLDTAVALYLGLT